MLYWDRELGGEVEIDGCGEGEEECKLPRHSKGFDVDDSELFNNNAVIN